jgi:hypothetical protein
LLLVYCATSFHTSIIIIAFITSKKFIAIVM